MIKILILFCVMSIVYHFKWMCPFSSLDKGRNSYTKSLHREWDVEFHVFGVWCHIFKQGTSIGQKFRRKQQRFSKSYWGYSHQQAASFNSRSLSKNQTFFIGKIDQFAAWKNQENPYLSSSSKDAWFHFRRKPRHFSVSRSYTTD